MRYSKKDNSRTYNTASKECGIRKRITVGHTILHYRVKSKKILEKKNKKSNMRYSMSYCYLFFNTASKDAVLCFLLLPFFQYCILDVFFNAVLCFFAVTFFEYRVLLTFFLTRYRDFIITLFGITTGGYKMYMTGNL